MGNLDKLVDSFSKYTGEDSKSLTQDDITKASQALQELLVKQLENEIHENNLVTWEHDSDGDRPNYDNLIEWISLYYDLREK